MAIRFDELPGWEFNAEEVSFGVYKAFGVDRQGRNVEAKGTDPDEMIEKCRRYALDIMKGDYLLSTG